MAKVISELPMKLTPKAETQLRRMFDYAEIQSFPAATRRCIKKFDEQLSPGDSITLLTTFKDHYCFVLVEPTEIIVERIMSPMESQDFLARYVASQLQPNETVH